MLTLGPKTTGLRSVHTGRCLLQHWSCFIPPHFAGISQQPMLGGTGASAAGSSCCDCARRDRRWGSEGLSPTATPGLAPALKWMSGLSKTGQGGQIPPGQILQDTFLQDRFLQDILLQGRSGQPPSGQPPSGQILPGQTPPEEIPPGQAPPGEIPPGEAPPGQRPSCPALTSQHDPVSPCSDAAVVHWHSPAVPISLFLSL